METDRPNILVVEDDEEVRRALCDFLELEGYNAVAAADGWEALICSRLDRPDLIVLDLALPEMDGWQFLKKRRADAELESIPVCIVSGYRSENPAGEFPGTAYLTKPVDPAKLIGTVRELCGKKPTVH